MTCAWIDPIEMDMLMHVTLTHNTVKIGSTKALSAVHTPCAHAQLAPVKL